MGLVFGKPKVKGRSQYLPDLMTEPDTLAPHFAMFGIYQDTVPWTIVKKGINNIEVYGYSLLTLEDAVVASSKLAMPYVIVLHPLDSEDIFKKVEKATNPRYKMCVFAIEWRAN